MSDIRCEKCNIKNCTLDYSTTSCDCVKNVYNQARLDERKEWECAVGEMIIKYAGDIYTALPDIVQQIRSATIDEVIQISRAEIDFESQAEQKRFVEFMNALKTKPMKG